MTLAELLDFARWTKTRADRYDPHAWRLADAVVSLLGGAPASHVRTVEDDTGLYVTAIGKDVAMTSREAREIAVALLHAADRADAEEQAGRDAELVDERRHLPSGMDPT